MKSTASIDPSETLPGKFSRPLSIVAGRMTDWGKVRAQWEECFYIVQASSQNIERAL